MQPIATLGLALLQSDGGNPWGPLTALAVGVYGSAVVLCLVIGGGILSTAGLDPDNKTKGINWIKRGFRGGAFGLAAFFLYQFADSLF
ncbi:MAG: hypothetical protein ACFB50_08310 [Rubrobacteraceae bacterium]